MVRVLISLCVLALLSSPLAAREIAGVNVPESITGADGVELKLNGAGIRSKLFIKVYIAGLYLQSPYSDAESVLADDGQKKMLMHFLYKKVEKAKLVGAWNEGFEANLGADQLAALADRIQAFNEMFATVNKGDTIHLDYLPGTGTVVTVAGEKKGVVEGRDFANALFAIWLGEKPVTSDLKTSLLGG